jgi:hypothetical protein
MSQLLPKETLNLNSMSSSSNRPATGFQCNIEYYKCTTCRNEVEAEKHRDGCKNGHELVRVKIPDIKCDNCKGDAAQGVTR